MAPSSNDWANLGTPVGFERCVAGTVRELYGYVALLDGRDRAAAERHVTLVYRSLYRAARSGEMSSVALGQLRSAARRIWLDEARGRMSGAPARALPNTPASRVAQLSVVERAVLVFRHVNGMTIERTARELGRDPADIAAIGANAVRRLRGTDDTSGAWLRAYFGAEVNPAPGLVDRIVHGLGDDPALLLAPQPSSVDAPTEEIPATGTPAAAGAPIVTADSPPEPATSDEASEGLSADDVVWGDASGATPGTTDTTTDMATSELPATRRVPTTPPSGASTPAVPDGDELATTELPVVAPASTSTTPGMTGTTVAAPAPRRRSRAWIAPVAVLAVAALLVGAWIGFRSDDDTIRSTPQETVDATTTPVTPSTPTTSPATTAVPATTSPDTTVPDSSAPDTAATSPSTSVVEVIDAETSARFSPTCTSTIGADDPRSVSMPDTFGPLGSKPALVVDLPAAVDDAGEFEPRVRLQRLGAGLLVALSANEQQTFPDTVLSYVGFDGTVGWTRCYSQAVRVLDRPVGDLEAAIGLAGESGEVAWYPVAFDDGAIGEPLDPVTQLAIRAATEFDAPAPAGPGLAYRESGDRFVLTGVDGSGNDLWTDDTVIAPNDEGFVFATTETVGVVRVCGDPCSSSALRGYDLATGDVLWNLDGYSWAPVVADGYALVGHPDLGWDLIDVSTGEVLEGQHWDVDTFQTASGLDGDYRYVRDFGAAVVVVDGRTLTVWLPEGMPTGRSASLVS